MALRELGRLVPGAIVNLVLLYGVVVSGWSPGSIVLLFPAESIGIGLVTVGACGVAPAIRLVHQIDAASV